MPRCNPFALACCVTWISLQLHVLAAEPFRFQHEHVLGTSCEIKVWTETREQAESVQRSVLAEVERLDKVFSAYDPASELMKWQRGEIAGATLSRELVEVLKRSEYWRTVSQGAFDLRAGELGRLWKEAVKLQQVPSASQLESLCGSLHSAPYTIDDSLKVFKLDRCSLSLDAIAKGYILDAACERARRDHPSILQADESGVSVMIGGDIRVVGLVHQKVSIANPFRADENAEPIAGVVLAHSEGLATSGGYRRYYEIDGVRHSHVLDPRTGQSAGSLAAVTVIAPGGMDADAAATAVNVLGPVQGLELIEQLPGFAALLVLNTGDVITSKRWQAYEVKPATPNKRPVYVNVTLDDKEKTGLFVKFKLGSSAGGRYHRPYVAVWLEDKDGFPVKTAVLWLQTSGPGPRWHRDLTKWYSNDQLRKLVDQKELIGTISGATRGPGEYEARFDGTDNDGKPLKPGKYALCFEAAREHGTHQFTREAIEWSDKPIKKKELKPGTEFGAISYWFVPGTAAASASSTK